MIYRDAKNPNNRIIAIPSNISTELKTGRVENISFMFLRLINAHIIIVIIATIGINHFNTSISVPPVLTVPLHYMILLSML